MAQNTWKDAQHRSLLEKCKSKLQWHITSQRSEQPSSKNLQINAREGKCGVTGTLLHCWWECKLIQPLWRTVWRSKAMVFPVVMYGCESWTVKKAEHQRIGAFELWCWRRLLRVPWTAMKSNRSILKEISPACSLEGMMLKLKLQYFGHLMLRVDSLGKTLMLGGIGGRRRRGRQRMRWLDGITD